MVFRLTRSNAGMGALKLETLETPEMPLDLPEDRLQEDACKTSRSLSGPQPAATENKILVLKTRVTQLERELTVAHASIQDLTETTCFLRRTALNPAHARTVV